MVAAQHEDIQNARRAHSQQRQRPLLLVCTGRLLRTVHHLETESCTVIRSFLSPPNGPLSIRRSGPSRRVERSETDKPVAKKTGYVTARQQQTAPSHTVQQADGRNDIIYRAVEQRRRDRGPLPLSAIYTCRRRADENLAAGVLDDITLCVCVLWCRSRRVVVRVSVVAAATFHPLVRP